jgi:hypothetical protein
MKGVISMSSDLNGSPERQFLPLYFSLYYNAKGISSCFSFVLPLSLILAVLLALAWVLNSSDDTDIWQNVSLLRGGFDVFPLTAVLIVASLRVGMGPMLSSLLCWQFLVKRATRVSAGGEDC